jgi:hypothetical protein
MTSSSPANFHGGAGLMDGHRQWRQMQEGQPRGGTPGQAQSEREKRGSRHSDEHVSQVALDDPGMVTPPDRPKRRLGSGQQDRGGMGTDLGGRQAPGLVFLCLLLRLSPSSNQSNISNLDTGPV